MQQHADPGVAVLYVLLLAAAVFLMAAGENVTRRIRNRRRQP